MSWIDKSIKIFFENIAQCEKASGKKIGDLLKPEGRSNKAMQDDLRSVPTVSVSTSGTRSKLLLPYPAPFR